MIIINDFKTMDIDGDKDVLARATATGVALSTIDLTGYRLDADVLSKLFNEANRREDDESALLYAALKQAIKKAHESEVI